MQSEAVRLAEQQYQSNRRQAEQGILAPIDVVAAQTQVATFQQNAFAAQQALTVAENNLKPLMLPERTDPCGAPRWFPRPSPIPAPSPPRSTKPSGRRWPARRNWPKTASRREINALNTRGSPTTP